MYYFRQQVVLPRRYRTLVPTVQCITNCEEEAENLLTKECLRSYTSNWNLVHYKYAAYSGTYLELPKYVYFSIKIVPSLCGGSYFLNFQNIEGRRSER